MPSKIRSSTGARDVVARDAEMAMAMSAPSIAAAGLAWRDVLGVMAGFTIQPAMMVPAMLGVMLWRYHEYARRHRPRRPRGTCWAKPVRRTCRWRATAAGGRVKLERQLASGEGRESL